MHSTGNGLLSFFGRVLYVLWYVGLVTTPVAAMWWLSQMSSFLLMLI
jgi:hypothetical protein